MTVRARRGDKAPAFSLPADGGGRVSLADFKGRKLVLVFLSQGRYPGLHQGGHGLFRLARAFAKAGTEILGVSADPVARQDAFKPSTS